MGYGTVGWKSKGVEGVIVEIMEEGRGGSGGGMGVGGSGLVIVSDLVKRSESMLCQYDLLVYASIGSCMRVRLSWSGQ